MPRQRTNGKWSTQVECDGTIMHNTFSTKSEADAWAADLRSARDKRKRKKNTGESHQQKRQRCLDTYGNSSNLEARACQFLQTLLEGFEVAQVRDGAHTDLAVRLPEQTEWWGLQVKSSSKRNKLGKLFFSNINKYADTVVVCVNLAVNLGTGAEEVWLFHGRALAKFKKNFCIGRVSKYCNTPLPEVAVTLRDMLVPYVQRPLAWLDTDKLSIGHYIEHCAHELWKEKTGTHIARRQVGATENGVYDVMLNNNKIQEKVCYRQNSGFVTTLSKNAGRNSKGTRRRNPYELGDWDSLHAFLLAYRNDEGVWEFSGRGNWCVKVDSPKYAEMRQRVEKLELLGYWEIPSALLGDYFGKKTKLVLYPGEDFSTEVGLGTPSLTNSRVTTLWTRECFHSTLPAPPATGWPRR